MRLHLQCSGIFFTLNLLTLEADIFNTDLVSLGHKSMISYERICYWKNNPIAKKNNFGLPRRVIYCSIG